MSGTKTWGNATWYLFHTMAEKIHEDHFTSMKYKMFSFIVQICAILPCPECSEHASGMLKRANINNIKTKAHFIEFLREFHNMVNKRLNKPEFTAEEVGSKYKTAITNQIIPYFFQSFKVNVSDNKLKLAGFRRDRILMTFSTWINNNMDKFSY